MNPPLLRLFVYGSLKHGFANYSRYCGGVRSLEAAHVGGRLLRIPSGFPVLDVAEESILARATADPFEDLETQQRFTREWMQEGSQARVSACRESLRGKRRVQGEMLSFADPADRLRALDRLEAFQVNRRGAYERVLISVFSRTPQQPIAVWTYTTGALSKHRPIILTGCWNGFSG